MKSVIAVTGAHGFIGTHFIASLPRNVYTVRLFDQVRHDLLKPDSLMEFLTGVQAIVHLAGVNRGAQSDFLRVNTAGTAGLIQAAKTYCPTARIIFASSFQVYLPHLPYGLSKAIAEEILRIYVRHNSASAVILRMSNVYGPGAKPNYNSVIATFVDALAHERPLRIDGDGSQKRDYIYITDVAHAISRALEGQLSEQLTTVDICSGETHSIAEIVALLKKLSPKPFSVEYNDKRQNEEVYPERLLHAAQELLGWQPRVTLEEGLHRTLTSVLAE